MKIIVNTLKMIEKMIVVMSIMIALGMVNNGTLDMHLFKQTLVYCVLVGAVLGGGLFVFETEKLSLKAAYVLHFLLGYAAINIFEGVVFEGSFLPNSPLINYLYKLGVYLAAYLLISAVAIYKEKIMARKMSDKIKEIKNKA